MPKGKKKQTDEEVLGQIFDFIFKEAKKKPEKRKPIKMGGPIGTNELTEGIAAALEMPALFVNDQILSSMNDALTIEFGRIKANESGSLNAKLTTTSLIGFLSDPNKFFDKPKDAARMGIRDAMKAGFMGRVHQELISNAWARKYNLDLDARKAILGHYQAESIGREAEAGRAFAMAAGAAIGGNDDSRKNYVASRSAELLGREMFGRSGWDSLSEEKKAGLQKALIRGNDAVQDYFENTYHGTSRFADEAMGRYFSLQELWKTDDMKKAGARVSEKDGIDVFDLKNYNLLETRNLEGRIADMQTYLRRNPGLSINEKQKIVVGIEKLQQASVIVTGNHLDLAKVQGAKIELKRMVEDYKTKLEAAQRAGDRDGVKYYKDQIKNLKSGDRQLNLLNFWGNVGKREGQIDSLKDVLGEGLATKGISSILDGSFYDKNRNFFYLPVTEQKVSFGSHVWEVADENGIKKPIKHDEEITVFVPDIGRNQMSSAYKAFLTNIYYLTPRSMMRTLFVNGEGFVYLAHLNEQRFIREFGIGKIDFTKLLKNDAGLLAALRSKGMTDGHIGSLQFSAKLAQIFSFGQRKRDLIKNWMDDHFFKKMRQRVYNSLIKRITDKEALALLEKWLVKGGFEVVAKAIVIGILDALGIAATGGVGSFIVPILSALVVDILYGIVKTLVLVVLLISAGLAGIAFLGGAKMVHEFDSMTYAYTNVAPGEVVTNPNFRGTGELIDPTGPTGPMGNFVGGTLPDGVKCLLGAGSFACSQGPYGSYSHTKVAAIDVTGVEYFYAPTFCGNGNCKVTYSASITCTYIDKIDHLQKVGPAGGMVKFVATYGSTTYEFTLIHVNTTYGVGSTLSSGERVARVMTQEETTDKCSSGKHIHIQTKANGSVVDPREVLNNGTSNGGFACSIGVCPAK